MLKVVECDWYNEDYPNKTFLQYAHENFEDLSISEKVEALRSIFDNYYSIIYDEDHEKIFVYGHGEMREINDNLLLDLIDNALESGG